MGYPDYAGRKPLVVRSLGKRQHRLNSIYQYIAHRITPFKM